MFNLRALFHKKRAEQEMDDELRFHLEKQIEQNIAQGMSAEEARYAALRQFGNVGQLKEECRDSWGVRFISELAQDLRYGLRQLRRNPGFTVVAVLTLALGIGANTAFFSVMNAALLRYLPVPNPQQLVFLHTQGFPSGATETGNSRDTFNLATFERFRTDHRAFQSLVAFVPLAIGKVSVRSGKEPEAADVDMVSGNFFSGLGVRLARGRAFTLQDESRHSQVAVLSYNYWTQRFDRNPSVIGQTVYIKSLPFTIIGVADRGFVGVEPDNTPTDLWIPFQGKPDLKPWGLSPRDSQGLYGSPDFWFLMMVGRLKPGISWRQAIAQLQSVYQHSAYQGIGAPSHGEHVPQLYFSAMGGIRKLSEEFNAPMIALAVMVAVVLLIACINVAVLLIARNASREREFSVRVALGESLRRLFRQLLAEGLLLAGAGSAIAWFFALWAAKILAVWAELNVDVAPDGTVFLFTLAIGLATALVLALAPLRNAWRVPASADLKGSSRGLGRSRLRGQQGVMATQIALCLALLLGAGLLIRTLRNLEDTNLGFHASGLLVFGITPPTSVHTNAATLHFWQSLLDRLRVLPGVESATLTGNRIGSGWSNNTNVRVDGAVPQGDRGSMVQWNNVGPDFCHVLGIPLLEGRGFTDADTATAPKVVVVNKTFARWYLPGHNPVGHEIEITKNQPFTIIGVAGNSKYTGVREVDVPMAYFPYTQIPGGGTMAVELRAYASPLALLPEVRHAIAEFAPNVPLLQPMTQQAQMQETYSSARMFARLAMFFGFLAGLLVLTGLYGTIAYRVSHRTQEIGVRMALGAQRGQVLWMVLREGLTVTLIGAVIGLPLALAGARLLGSMLYGIKATDEVSIIGALVGITIIAVVASIIPARRAAKVDPMVALRYE